MCPWKLSGFLWGLNSFVYRYLLHGQSPGLEMTHLKDNSSRKVFFWMYWEGKRLSDVFCKTRNFGVFPNGLSSVWNIMPWYSSSWCVCTGKHLPSLHLVLSQSCGTSCTFLTHHIPVERGERSSRNFFWVGDNAIFYCFVSIQHDQRCLSHPQGVDVSVDVG